MEEAREKRPPEEEPIELPVPGRFEGMRLTQFLRHQLPRLSRGTGIRLLQTGKIALCGQTVYEDTVLAKGMWITVSLIKSPGDPTLAMLPLDILFEDERLIAINKPAGEVVTRGRQDEVSKILDSVREHFAARGEADAAPRVVHRLDRDTTGALVMAKTKDAQRWLTRQFVEHKVEKEYLALVDGEIYEESGSVDLKIRPASRRSTQMKTSAATGREALTRYEVAESFRNFTLLRVFPETGRTHQVRLHLSAIGHPLAVDPMYGSRSELLLSSLKRGYRPTAARPESPIIDRLTLHSHSLKFQPAPDLSPLEIEAPISEDFEHLLRCLRKYRKARSDMRRR